MKKILILLFSIFLLVSCDTLQTSNTITIETGNSYWRYKPYYINYYRYNYQLYQNYQRRVIIIKQHSQRIHNNFREYYNSIG